MLLCFLAVSIVGRWSPSLTRSHATVEDHRATIFSRSVDCRSMVPIASRDRVLHEGPTCDDDKHYNAPTMKLNFSLRTLLLAMIPLSIVAAFLGTWSGGTMILYGLFIASFWLLIAVALSAAVYMTASLAGGWLIRRGNKTKPISVHEAE